MSSSIFCFYLSGFFYFILNVAKLKLVFCKLLVIFVKGGFWVFDWLDFYLRQGGYSFTCVCLFVCLSVCLSGNRISHNLLIKFLWNFTELLDIIVGHNPATNSLDFEWPWFKRKVTRGQKVKLVSQEFTSAGVGKRQGLKRQTLRSVNKSLRRSYATTPQTHYNQFYLMFAASAITDRSGVLLSCVNISLQW